MRGLLLLLVLIVMLFAVVVALRTTAMAVPRTMGHHEIMPLAVINTAVLVLVQRPECIGVGVRKAGFEFFPGDNAVTAAVHFRKMGREIA